MTKRLLHSVRVWVALVALLLAGAWVPGVARAAEATVDAPVRMFQEYHVSVSGLQSSFEYEIVPLEADAPLPLDKSGQQVRSFTLTRSQELWLTFPVVVQTGSSTYSYHYRLRPAATELSDGLYYVDILSTSLAAGINEYYLEIFVQEDGQDPASAQVVPLVHVEGLDGPKVSDPGWRVGYKEPTPSKSDDSKQTTDQKTDSSAAKTSAAKQSQKTSLSKTGDVWSPELVMLLCVAGVVFVRLGALLQRIRRGEGHA